ncbi:hypothetical protein LTS18_002460, partial [Coniosporium uncinatum]
MSSSPDTQSPNGFDTPQRELTAETNTSGFTAVNGRGSPPQTSMSKAKMVEDDVRSRSHSSPESPLGARPLSTREEDGMHVNGNSRPYGAHDENTQASGVSSPGKRKRSDSDHVLAEFSHPSAPRRKVVNGISRSSSDTQGHAWHDSPKQGMQRLPPPQPNYPTSEASVREHSWYARPGEDSSEAAMAEALQRESRNMDAQQQRPHDLSPYQDSYGTPQSQSAPPP